ncbi:MobQ family relaxase [uncultured Tateyamaria sp.]|uniref:MobQ family relaxase n=1 Tax=uncultured Tateyamaria sp. TaxID=455651 RepID=UPI00260CAD9C|nr:MobQ family relaxase [uncultured Tateyamaria sp.]
MAVQSSRLHAKPISRSKQQSAVASAAYRAGEKLEDKRVGETFDYTRKQSVEATRIMAPAPAPDWVLDRATLWNTVEATEKRKDAQLAREVQVAIPDELPKDVREKLVWDFCHDNFVSMGMIVDVAIHGPTKENPRNWHWHGMLTMRTIGPDGFGLKERSWNENQHVERWKRNWETACNAALEQIGSSTRVDMRSIEDRHAEQLRFAAEATNWIDRMRFEIEAARLDYTARPNLPLYPLSERSRGP